MGPAEDPIHELETYGDIQDFQDLEEEQNRIEILLQKYVPPSQALWYGRALFIMAHWINEVVSNIENHPKVKEKYTYNGRCLVARDEDEQHTLKLYDGYYMLKEVTAERLAKFFEATKDWAKDTSHEADFVELRDWLRDEFVWTAKSRLENLRNLGHIRLNSDSPTSKPENKTKKLPSSNEPSIPPTDSSFWDTYRDQIDNGNK